MLSNSTEDFDRVLPRIEISSRHPDVMSPDVLLSIAVTLATPLHGSVYAAVY